MPKKPNRTDLQNYVPAGNGDESGEYRGGTSTSEGTHDSDWENYRKVLEAKKEALGKAFNPAGKPEEKAIEELDRKLPKVDFTPAKDIQEATKYAKSLGVKFVDWGDMSLEAVNTINKRVAQWFKAYPEIRDNMNYIGAYQSIGRTIVDNFESEIRAVLADMGVSVNEALLRLRKKTRVSSGVWATSFSGAGVNGSADNAKMSGIGFNASLFRPKAYQETKGKMSEGETAGWHPAGTGDLTGTIDHEMGHRLDRIYNMSERIDVLVEHDNLKDMSRLARQFGGEPKEKLSRYAETNAKEFVAEAVSQLYGTGEAGQYALKIKEVLENARKERNKR